MSALPVGATSAAEIDPAPLAAELTRTSEPWVLLIDGRSGAGKTVLARELAARTGATLVSLDDVYPGWDGLDAGSDAVVGIIRTGRWRRWNWVVDAPGEWAQVARDGNLIVEGCGALSRAARAEATHAWWLERDDASRRHRALTRADGYSYAPHWEQWARQEERFAEREHPTTHATKVISAGAASAS